MGLAWPRLPIRENTYFLREDAGFHNWSVLGKDISLSCILSEHMTPFEVLFVPFFHNSLFYRKISQNCLILLQNLTAFTFGLVIFRGSGAWNSSCLRRRSLWLWRPDPNIDSYESFLFLKKKTLLSFNISRLNIPYSNPLCVLIQP